MNDSGIIFLAPKEPVLTPNQFNRLANILDNAGNVFLAITVVSPLVVGIDRTDVGVIVIGILTTLTSWGTSIVLAKKGTV